MKKASETIAPLDRIDQQARRFYKKHPNRKIRFHTLKRTLENLRYANEVLIHERLQEEETLALQCAIYLAYFGYQLGEADPAHKSMELAKEYLRKLGFPDSLIHTVSLLLWTAEDQQETHLFAIYSDVMNHHLGGEDFIAEEKKLRAERIASGQYRGSKKKWWKKRLPEISLHTFKTLYCQQSLSYRQSQNLELLKARVYSSPKNEQGDKKQQPKALPVPATRRPGRGVETMFRITSGNNQRLSDMADKKAHILITVNSIILSAIISLVLRRVDKQNFLLIPSIVLLANCLVTMILSILATRPKIPDGTFQEQQLQQKEVNLLYFGNFYSMPLGEYTKGMFSVMNDSVFLYHMLISDVYAQGVVLGRKYRLLRLAYNIFMYGLILSICCFIIFSLFIR
jgi:hypothetical protein